MITVKGKVFQEGMAVCPILTGRSVANGALMNNSCDAPAGKVWSLFSTVSEAPQAPSWAVAPLVSRSFILGKDSGMSNQWSFLCDKQAKKTNGVTWHPATAQSMRVQLQMGISNPVLKLLLTRR
jgi:hypothetical protein